MHHDFIAKKLKNNSNEINEGIDSIGLVISSGLNDRYSSEYFGLIDITLENPTFHWVRIKNINIDFDDSTLNKNLMITSGNDLNDWRIASANKLALEDYNSAVRNAIWAGFAEGLAASASETKDKTAGAVESVVALGIAGSLTVSEYHKFKLENESSHAFPEDHIFFDKFGVPPGMFVRKWLLINSSTDLGKRYVYYCILEIETEDGQIGRYYLQFRNDSHHTYSTVWQSHILDMIRSQDQDSNGLQYP
jgi:hypothetical protein